MSTITGHTIRGCEKLEKLQKLQKGPGGEVIVLLLNASEEEEQTERQSVGARGKQTRQSDVQD